MKPNVLFLMTDQQRFDTIAALGNARIYTPNLDRLVNRGISFRNAYSPCPVCVAARYTVHTGRLPSTTRVFSNAQSLPVPSQAQAMEERCGLYLARMMKLLGYRTFGIGKFHTQPTYEDIGFEVYLHSEELYATPEERARDSYASWIRREHNAFDFIEMLMGERTEMYYMPQMSPLPSELTVEGWAADRAVEQIQLQDKQPYFGFVSFVGPHPPFAPPLPYNRMYDPDRMLDPCESDITLDHMDEQIPWMNYLVWADDISISLARVLKARYYAEISYIDSCIGRILDAVEAGSDAHNTLICFFSDHGDHLGDHHAWQKESFFEESCHIPFLLSWPIQLPPHAFNDELMSLADLYAIATHAAGSTDIRDGIDVLATLNGTAPSRDRIIGMYGEPGTLQFKVMIRSKQWKYIYIANGGREQLFNLTTDPHELHNRVTDQPDVCQSLRIDAVNACKMSGAMAALNETRDELRRLPFYERERRRIYQFDQSHSVFGFPTRPQDVLI